VCGGQPVYDAAYDFFGLPVERFIAWDPANTVESSRDTSTPKYANQNYTF